MTDSVEVFRLENAIREETAFLTDRESENAEVRTRLMRSLDSVRDRIGRQEALRLEVLIERRTCNGRA